METQKKASKKIALILLSCISVVLIILMIIAAGNRSKVISCTQTSDQPNLGYKTETTIEIRYDENIVKLVKSTKKIEAKDKQKLEELINSYSSQYDLNNASYGGYTQSTSNGDDTHATFNGEIDYSKVDMQKFIKDNPSMEQYTESAKLTKDGAKRMYEASGFECKE